MQDVGEQAELTNSVMGFRRLGMNHFADWTQEEFEAMLLPNKGRPGRPSLGITVFDGVRVRLHRPEVNSAHLLPSYVDWRGTPADSPVKDQAACGSCWVSHMLCLKAAIFAAPASKLCRGIFKTR